jgi:hypothetical protein
MAEWRRHVERKPFAPSFHRARGVDLLARLKQLILPICRSLELQID